MHVVFDSSAIWLGRPLTGTNAKYLAAYLKHADVELHVPEVVVLETQTLIRERVSAEHKKLAKSVEEFRKQGVRLAFRRDPESLTQAALKVFDRRLDSLQIDRLAIPETGGHDEVLQRLQSGKRPFRGTPDQRDVGYRDYLVWKTILGLAGSGDGDVAFVTGNIRDFGEESPEGSRLHSELVAESRDIGLEVKLYTSVEQFIADVVKPSLPVAARVEALLSLRPQQKRLREWISDHIGEEGSGYVIESMMAWKGIDIETVTIASGYDVEDLSIEGARELDPSTVVVDVLARMELLVDFYVFKADAALLDYEDFRGLSDWNKHYYWGQTEMDASVDLSVTLSVVQDKVEPQSLSISSVTIETS